MSFPLFEKNIRQKHFRLLPVGIRKHHSPFGHNRVDTPLDSQNRGALMASRKRARLAPRRPGIDSHLDQNLPNIPFKANNLLFSTKKIPYNFDINSSNLTCIYSLCLWPFSVPSLSHLADNAVFSLNGAYDAFAFISST